MKLTQSVKTTVLTGALLCSYFSPQLLAERDKADILIDVLVAKGVLSADEAITIRDEVNAVAAAENPYRSEAANVSITEVVEEAAPASAPDFTPIPMPSKLSKLKLYGDARFRFQGEEVNDNTTRTRWRYRARLGADYTFANNAFKFGARLDSALANDSTNVTMGGFFDRADDALRTGLLYLQYENDWTTLVGGKQKNPYTFDKGFWDSDITPEGLTEMFHLGNWDLRFGQYIIDDEREDRGGGDDFLFVGQAEWANDDGFQVAPLFLATTNGVSRHSELGQFIGENSIRDFRDFFVVALPVEYNFELGGVKQKVYATYGTNLKGGDAVRREDSPFYNEVYTGDEDVFYNFGYTYGSAKKPGEWSLGFEYRHIEGAAMTPNLSDSDFGKNSTNHEGFLVQYKYVFTDFFSAGFIYMDSSLIDDQYTADVVANEGTKLLQVDAMVSF